MSSALRVPGLVPSVVPRLGVRLAFAALLSVTAACGGGAPAGGGGGNGPPDGTVEQVIVLPQDDEEIGAIVAASGGALRGEVEGTDWFLVLAPAGLSAEEYVVRLEADVRVLDASVEVDLGAPEGEGSTIPFLGSELPMMISSQPELVRIGVDRAHQVSLGDGVRVAVLDSGVDASHPSLAGRVDMAAGWDFVAGDPDPSDEPNGLDDDGDGRIDEGRGHGTFVASLVLAVAPNATIVPFRVLDSDSRGTESALAAAITRATTASVDVINLSVGMRVEAKSVQQAVQRARAVGVAVVVAAGNTGADDVTFPAALSDGLSVTAVGSDDRKPSFASYGGDVDLCAPGVDLVGAFPSPNGTARWSGTSFSAALVSGACALVRSRDPALSPGALFQLLEDTSRDVDPSNPALQGELGRGRLDLAAALGP
jgi:hypothetical protein